MATRFFDVAVVGAENATRRNRIAGALAFLLVVGLAACSNDDTYLAALLADPMADYRAEGLELVDSWEQAEKPGVLGGKPTHARVDRTYRIEVQSEVEALLRDAVSYAESQGWRMQEDMSVPTLFTGAKPLPPGDGRLSIALGPTDPAADRDGSSVLNIHLDFGSARFEDTSTTAP